MKWQGRKAADGLGIGGRAEERLGAATGGSLAPVHVWLTGD